MPERPIYRGFTLFEIAIALTVIGLVAGGVLAGWSFLRAAELRETAAEEERIATAARGFKDQYGALPGDMKDAIEYWGAQDLNPPTCKLAASVSQATCNGDGNGLVDDSAGSQEPYRFWQHLANAGMFRGRYSGVFGGAYQRGVNVPEGKIGGSWYYAGWVGTKSGDPGYYDGDYKHVIEFLGPDAPYPVITPKEAFEFDAKYDDGKPGLGRIRAFKSSVLPQCATSDVAGAAEYNTSLDSTACYLQFLNQF